MEETLEAIQRQLMDLASTNKDIVERLNTLEDGQTTLVEPGEKDKLPEVLQPMDPTNITVLTGGKEKSLSLTFGDGGDCSARSLRLFLDHFKLATAQNQGRHVEGWTNAEFRSRELRLQLRGEPALWLSHESAMASAWTRDDSQIIQRLRHRYIETQSLELNIVMFEELRQEEGETLASYMTRCQEKGMEAFAELGEPRSTQQRIVWKFLSGIRDTQVRSEVIRQKWMKNPMEAKPYEEILLIAEQAKLDRMAAVATGKPGGQVFKATPVSRIKDRRRAAPRPQRHSGESSVGSTPSPSPKSGRSSIGSSGLSSDSVVSPSGVEQGNFLCHFCKTRSHFGGWKACPKRATDDPGWKPQGFQ